MKSVVLYSHNDFVKSKLGTLFVISHLHDDMMNAVKHAKEVQPGL